MLESLSPLPADPLFALFADYRLDARPEKMNLGIGVYATEAGGSFVLPVVERAARELPTDNFDYAPIGGVPEFLEGAGRLLFGPGFDRATFASQAACGGTHACRLLGELLRRAGYADLLLAAPTWVNHAQIFAPFSIASFPHLGADGNPDVDGYRRAIESVARPTVLLLHGGSAHNPTGRNLTLDDLRALVPVIRSRPVFVLVDFAYLGLGDGIEEDAAFARFLCAELSDVAVAMSFSKNATLYCHRTGALFVKAENAPVVESHLRALVRATVSNPPAPGQRILRSVFEGAADEWRRELDGMRESVNRRRRALADAVPGLMALRDTRGLFGMLPVTKEQVRELRERFAVYLPDSGRINFAGIPMDRIDYLSNAINEIL